MVPPAVSVVLSGIHRLRRARPTGFESVTFGFAARPLVHAHTFSCPRKLFQFLFQPFRIPEYRRNRRGSRKGFSGSTCGDDFRYHGWYRHPATTASRLDQGPFRVASQAVLRVIGATGFEPATFRPPVDSKPPSIRSAASHASLLSPTIDARDTWDTSIGTTAVRLPSRPSYRASGPPDEHSGGPIRTYDLANTGALRADRPSESCPDEARGLL